MIRRKTRIIKIGNVYIGGNNPVAIQSMTKTKTADIERTIRQINELEKGGCEIVRVAVRDSADAKAIKKIKKGIQIPLVADIHFNWHLAMEAIDNGADKIRLNPGNIYEGRQIKEIISALKDAKIPLRIGVNSGSVKNLNSKRLSLPDKLVASALNYIKIIEKLKFYDIVVSLKASNVSDTIEAYHKMAKASCDYPFHLGVTATGLPYVGIVKSSIATGALLLEGIGDTIRVSLTDKPEAEVKIAKIILEVLGLRHFGPEIISCPTCGRCEVDLIKIVKEFEDSLAGLPVSQLVGSTGKQANAAVGATPPFGGGRQTGKPIKVAIMGCVVNGPGEAKEADLGIAFGKKDGLLFRKGEPIRKISSDRCVDVLLEELGKFQD